MIFSPVSDTVLRTSVGFLSDQEKETKTGATASILSLDSNLGLDFDSIFHNTLILFVIFLDIGTTFEAFETCGRGDSGVGAQDFVQDLGMMNGAELESLRWISEVAEQSDKRDGSGQADEVLIPSCMTAFYCIRL